MRSKLFQDKPKDKHREYVYKHAIHYAFQALRAQAQAKRAHTVNLYTRTYNPLCIHSSSRRSQKSANTLNMHTNMQYTMHYKLFQSAKTVNMNTSMQSTMHSKLFQDKPKGRKLQSTKRSKLFKDNPQKRKHRKYAYKHATHSKLVQYRPTDCKHCKYQYEHAIHYAFQALAGQAKRGQTPEICIQTCNPLCIPSSSKTN